MDFVSPPPKGLDTECSICFGSLHVDPHQNLNCGHHLCGNCVHKLKKEDHDHCPECRAPLQISADKSLQRVLKSLEVYCQHKGDGCTWQGDLGDLDHHEKDVCLYVKLSCPYGCGHIATRTLMDEHNLFICSLRPASCIYCEFTSTYADVNNNHYSVCSLYPMTCSCYTTLTRKDLDNHKKMTCPNTEVMCKFVGYGCEWKGMRKDESDHLAIELSNHFMKVTEQLQARVLRLEKNEAKLRQMNKELEAKLVKLGDKGTPCTDHRKMLVKAAKPKCEHQSFVDDVDSDSSTTEDEENVHTKIFSIIKQSSTPITFTYKLNKFRKHQKSKAGKEVCYSDPFEVSANYMMQLRVHPNGTGKGEGSHVSVYVCLLQQLSQLASLVYVPPFRGSVHVSIRGVSVSVNKLITYDENTPSHLTACTSTSKSGYLASKGNGMQRFLPHEDLSKYLINGSLSFEVNVISSL